VRLVYLASAEADLRWFKLYYTRTFPEGRKMADAQFLHTQQLLRENPMMGHAIEEIPGVREHHVPRTPFSFVYRLRDDRIEVLRVQDKRAGKRL
jgi:toxin ParE1/3/4